MYTNRLYRGRNLINRVICVSSERGRMATEGGQTEGYILDKEPVRWRVIQFLDPVEVIIVVVIAVVIEIY